MAIQTTYPYKDNVYIVKQYGEHLAKIIYIKHLRESGWELEEPENKPKGKKEVVNAEKLSCNLARAKSTVKEYALCNPWTYWVTLTISPDKYDRQDLKSYVTDFAEFLHGYNRRCASNDKVKYVLIPEKHKDGAWHMHGLINGIRDRDLFINDNGYLDWFQYREKFGYISLDKIRDIEKTANYALKYMTKDSEKNVAERNARLYYSSHGLQKANVLYRGHADFHSDWDFEDTDGYFKVKNIDLRKTAVSEVLGGAEYDVATSL